MTERDTEVPPMQSNIRIGIVYNLKKGIHTEAPDSEAEYDSIETVYGIQNALKKSGYEVVLLEAGKDLPEKLLFAKVDFVFNIAEGMNGRGREAQIPALLTMLDIPFSGSDETTLCLALDKALTKRLLSTYRIRTPKFTVLKKGEKPQISRLQYPVIIKPNAEGSSKGISDVSIVENRKELLTLANKCMLLYQQDFLAEEYIEGREFTVGILGNGNDVKVFTPMEIVYKKATQGEYHVYSYNVKQEYKSYVEYHCPSNIEKSIEDEMIRTAKTIYHVMGCRDFARIDFRVSKDGKVYFIEINPLPGLAPGYSDYPMLAAFCGVEYDTLVTEVFHAAAKRCGLIQQEGELIAR